MIPSDVKDADGYLYGECLGVLALDVDTNTIKNLYAYRTYLLKPEDKGSFVLSGDPCTASYAIMAAGATSIIFEKNTRTPLPISPTPQDSSVFRAHLKCRR